MKFKVGDRVKFVKSIYGHSSDVKVGEIYKIKTVDTTGIPYQIENLEWFMEEELESVEYTYEDLKKAPIGTKVTFENNAVLIKLHNNYYRECKEMGYYRNEQDLRNLKDNLSGVLGKIIKIEEPEYKTVYEAKKEILDETEKRYLKGVIRPFRSKVLQIAKKYDCFTELEYIKITIKDDASLEFPSFSKNTMYKNMEINKKYTLEELGL